MTGHMFATRTRFRAAFTLIELLVVMAIIGVLASILLPALSAAKRSAKGAACMSNLHQIGLGLSLYIDDNANHFPLCAGLLPSQNTNLPSIRNTLLSYVPNGDVFHCPEDSTVFYQEGTSYEWNMFFNGLSYLSPPSDGTAPNNIVTIYQGMLNTPLLGDANAFHVASPPMIGRYALYLGDRVDQYKLPIPLTLLSSQ